MTGLHPGRIMHLVGTHVDTKASEDVDKEHTVVRTWWTTMEEYLMTPEARYRRPERRSDGALDLRERLRLRRRFRKDTFRVIVFCNHSVFIAFPG